ncbi:MAG: hypothetical protein Q8K75_00605, partial [Chlamydiales bacterium]|nr:hypothetical protein [Chlamydiales bacterium]
MYKLALFLLLTCSSHSLQAADLHLTAETESLASVHGCVNAISGDFFFTETGLATSNVSPVHYTTSYDSGHQFPSPRGFGIGAYFPTIMFNLDVDTKHERADLLAWEREGFTVPLKGHFTHHAIRFSVHSDLFKLGYTNYSEAGISGRNNIKNRQITYRGFGKNYTWGTFEVVEGCGTKRIYQPIREDKDIGWRLSSEIRPNGHKVLYEYQGFINSAIPSRLKVTNADESITYGTLNFISRPDGYSVEASNGDRADYVTAPFGIRYSENIPSIGPTIFEKKSVQLKTMNSSQGIETHYAISTIGKGTLQKISHISKPNNRFLNITYRPSDGKVTALHAPVGADAAPIQVASFQYGDKYTEVFDAHSTKTLYRYPTNKVSTVEKYAKDGSIYSTKHFVWGESGPQQGHLLARGLSKGTKEFVTYTIGTYDERGNIIKEELFGNLSGHGHNTFTIGFDSRPVKLIDAPHKPTRKPKKKKRYVPGPPVESVATHYVYSKDGFNLLLEEHHLDSISFFHNYLENTNLPISKFRTYCGEIISREFHEYQDGLLVKTIADDGSSPDSNNLAGVHTRTFQKIVRRNNSPAIGSPESVIEGFLDLSSGSEIQLKRTLYHYDSREKVVQEDIYDRDNNHCYSLFHAYDSKGNLVSQTDPIGRVTNYEYDENRNCVGEALLDSGVNIRHHYDCANRLIRTEEYHRDSSILTTSYSYDYLGNRVAMVDHFGNETRYVYDEFGRQTQIIHPKCQNSIGDAYQAIETKKYDLFGNVIEEINALGHTTGTKYNIRNQPIEITQADGSKERYEYNLNSSVRTKWEPSGVYHHYDYDGHLRLTRTATYAPDGTFLHATTNEYAGSNLVKVIDAMGYATEYRYDGAGRKIEEIQPAGTRISYAYDRLGRLHETTHWIDDHNFVRTIHDFDFLDRPIAMHSEDQDGTLQRKESYEYDLRGNKTRVAVAIDEHSASQTTTEYDTRNRPTRILDACGHVTTIHNFERYSNPLGGYLFSKTTTDPLATQTIEIHDPLGRPWICEKRNPSGELISHQKLSYDEAGRKIQQVDTAHAEGAERECYTVDWALDSMDRPLFVTESGKDGSRKTTAYSYDALGRLKTITKPDGVVLHHDYDALGRLVKLTSSDQSICYLYQYDSNNNLLRVEDFTQGTETRRTYDEQDRMIGEELANGLAVAYTYDGLGRPEEIVLPNQFTIQYSYQGKNCVKVAKCDQHKNVVYQHTYDSHDLRGITKEATLPCNATISFLHDALARPTEIAS